VLFELRGQDLGQFPDAGLIYRVADIEDLSVRAAIFVLDNPEKTFYPIPDIGETPLLFPPVHQLDRRAGNQVQDKLGDGPGTADPGGIQTVQPRTEPVKWAEESEAEPFLGTVSPDDPIEELLAAAIDPALHLDRPVTRLLLFSSNSSSGHMP